MLVSAVQHHESAIYMYISSWTSLPLTPSPIPPISPPQSTELSFLCYTGFHLSSHSPFVLPSFSASPVFSLLHLSDALSAAPDPSIPVALETLRLHTHPSILQLFTCYYPHGPSCQVYLVRSKTLSFRN